MRYLSLVVAILFANAARADDKADFFEKQVRPLLTEHCFKCHGDDKPKGGLRLTSQAELLQGGDSGPAAISGKPDDSLLVKAINYRDDQFKMPPKGKLADRDIQTLTRWVALGLPWPADKPATIAATGKFQITEEQRRFWSFRPVQVRPAPSVKNSSWPQDDLDRFILAQLEQNGLQPSAPADKRTLIRRATFDLTGLPPTRIEIDAFLTDDSPKAFARVVERLLASPAYGERWGRHWLDLVRYTDSFDARGIGGEMDCADAWRYRDWVIQAFNDDLPYDRFVKMQVAGDLLDGPAGVVATGLLAIGNWGGGDADKEKLLTDIADDQVDVIGRTFMGLTVACARCHDHKFDPISTNDYYGLAGIFFSTHILPNVGPKTNGPPMLRVPLESAADKTKRMQAANRAMELEGALNREVEAQYRAFAERRRAETAAYLMAAWEYSQHPTVSIEAFAAERKLHAFALRRWIDLLSGGDDRLMLTKVRDVLGNPGVHGWRGAPDCPSLLVNSTSQPVNVLTFKLPPKSISVHPGPKSGVVLAWRSPVAGRVQVRGQLTDADPTCGDGIAWALDVRRSAGRTELATGAFANGGRQALPDGRGGKNLTSIDIAIGDVLELVVLPKGDHSCDTTLVDLTISTTIGDQIGQVWNAAADLTGDPLAGNPHADQYGHPGVWSFADMGERRRGADPIMPELAAWRKLPAGAPLFERKAAAEEAQRLFHRVDPASPFWLTSAEQEAVLDTEVRAKFAGLRRELEAVRKAAMAPAAFANGVQEGGVPGSPHAGVHDVRVHIRGRYDRLAEMVPRHFPEILAGDKPPIIQGSGRRELADWLTRPDHPLTARVLVNRIWQHHFGAGIVRTPSNFGKLGVAPTHPELLDWLADQFVRSGWSMKQMHRVIMLSAAYRQDSVPSAELLQRDPDNRLFGRVSRRRLEAEALRDNLLAVAGRLDRTAGGPGVRDFANPRRSVYQMTVRSDRSGFGPLFDVADPTAPIDTRTVSTVAPQALFLLNHPFVTENVKALSERILKTAGDDSGKIRRAYVDLYGRTPSADEERLGLSFLRSQPPDSAWFAYCQMLICANEFLYVD